MKSAVQLRHGASSLALHKCALAAGRRSFSAVAAGCGLDVFHPSQIHHLVPAAAAEFIVAKAARLRPDNVCVLRGGGGEWKRLLATCHMQGLARPLAGLDNCYITRTDPADVARVESRTFIASDDRRATLADTRSGAASQLGNWMPVEEMDGIFDQRFQGAMKGRTMYVIPFSMGIIGSRMYKLGVELTDSPYVAAAMSVMTRHVGAETLEALMSEPFIKCTHSVGSPLPAKSPPVQSWPCDPARTIIGHVPARDEILSYGSGYGGNSLLGKKCLALRLGSVVANREGWLAEHMLILGITCPEGKKRYIAAAFPSACGKTNLAMMQPTLPGYKVECVGDDIAWLWFDDEGNLRAVNPEAGLFGVAPGTSPQTNPIAMRALGRDVLFTNVAETLDGRYHWEGLKGDDEPLYDWQGRMWHKSQYSSPSSHPNARFCVPARNLSNLDPAFHSGDGVVVEAIMFGGRRPKGVPLVYESFDWPHGVYYGASMRSEATAAAEHKGKVIMHDPFAMRPFFGYNFGKYLQHWLDLPKQHENAKLPRIYKVNWFRQCPQSGAFLWPGFGENIRVLDWIVRRCAGEHGIAERSRLGYVPKREKFRLDGLESPVDWDALFEVDTDYWLKETEAVKAYLDEQVGDDLPEEISAQRHKLQNRLQS